MLLLTAKAAREIVEAVDATAKAIEANTEALERLEGKIGGKTDA